MKCHTKLLWQFGRVLLHTFLSLCKKFKNRFYRYIFAICRLFTKNNLVYHNNSWSLFFRFIISVLKIPWKSLFFWKENQATPHPNREMIMFLSPQTTTLSIRLHQYTRYHDSIELASLFGLNRQARSVNWCY